MTEDVKAIIGKLGTRLPPTLDELLEARDEDFSPHSWEEAKALIASGDLGFLGRWPSEARRYVAWAEAVRSRYGSVTDFLCKERLQWAPLPDGHPERPPDSVFAYRSAVPFEHGDDYRILRNDWPYRWEAGITHVCVWLKNRIPVDVQDDGKTTPEGRRIVEQFVRKTFVEPLGDGGQERVLWFRNYTTLQSVAALEHFHVLLRDAPQLQVDRWTGNDVTVQESGQAF